MTGVGAAALAGVTALMPGRGAAQRTMDAVIGAFAAWTIVESLVFSGEIVVWVSFGAASAIAALAIAGLTLAELSTEAVVHSLEARTGSRATERAASEAA